MTQTYRGACHCGRITFEVRAELAYAVDCNCSVCHRKGALWHPAADEDLRVLTGEADLTLYQFNTKTAKHYFCKHCGIHPFIRPRLDPGLWAFNVRCIHGIDLSSLKIRSFDGQNWEATARAYYERLKKPPAALYGSTIMANQQSVSVATLKAIAEAFNAHDLDAIMEFFAEDCSLDMPRGPDPWGQRFTGKSAVRQGLATRFKGLPDVHYSDDRHWVSGNMGVSEWLLTGTMPDGARIQVRGCDHWEFRGGKVIRKDSYWKIVEKAR